MSPEFSDATAEAAAFAAANFLARELRRRCLLRLGLSLASLEFSSADTALSAMTLSTAADVSAAVSATGARSSVMTVASDVVSTDDVSVPDFFSDFFAFLGLDVSGVLSAFSVFALLGLSDFSTLVFSAFSTFSALGFSALAFSALDAFGLSALAVLAGVTSLSSARAAAWRRRVLATLLCCVSFSCLRSMALPSLSKTRYCR